MDRAEQYQKWKWEHPEDYQAMLERNRAWKAQNRGTPRGFMQMLLANAKTNAKARGHECTLTLEDLERLWSQQQGHCALTGDTMTTVSGKGRHATPTNVSLDRIDSSQGYMLNNIWLVCTYANRVKTDLSLDELLDACRKILDRHSLQEGAA